MMYGEERNIVKEFCESVKCADAYSVTCMIYDKVQKKGYPRFKTVLGWVKSYLKPCEIKPCVYKILNENGEIVYIGKTIRGIEVRKWEHEIKKLIVC